MLDLFRRVEYWRSFSLLIFIFLVSSSSVFAWNFEGDSVVKVNPSGDFYLSVAKGDVAGHSSINKFGHNSLVTTASDPEDVWGGGGLYNFYPVSAQSMQVVSTDVDDSVGGSGARSIMIFGLDSNWLEVSEVVNLSGSTPVNLSNQYIRMYRAFILEAGSSGTNEGDIEVEVFGGGDVGAFIISGDGQTQQAIYTIPAGKSGYFIKGYVGVSDGGNAASRESAIFKWKARLNNGVNGAWQTKGQIEVINDGSNWWQYQYGVPVGPLPEKTDIRIEASLVSASLGVVGGFDLVLVND